MLDKDSKSKARFQIDLDQSRDPRAYRDEHNLWGEDLRRIYRLVNFQAQAVENVDKTESRKFHKSTELPHLSIAIFGPSGSGKSSLLRTLADDVNRKYHGVLKETAPDLKIHSLPVIDPTTWSRTDQFLYAFLASALEEEREHLEEREHGPPQGLSPVQLAFQEVNEYLRVVDDPETPDEHDPLGLSLQKLERHTSGLRLRGALEKFVNALTKEFEASVVLLPVDDLDMAPDHLVESLKTYQSFLTHARLVPIFTFTDRMPEELIEVHYEAQLSTTETQRHLDEGRLPISQQLAVQFLSRCFPVRNRIRLGPAPARVQRAIYSFRPEQRTRDKAPATEELRILELLIHASFLLFGHPDKEDAHKVRAALRPSTLRRQMQVVDAMADCRLRAFRIPQFAKWTDPKIKAEALEILATGEELKKGKESAENRWSSWPARRQRSKVVHQNVQRSHRLGQLQEEVQSAFLLKVSEENELVAKDLEKLAERLKDLKIGATWATVFSGATWSLLNVHRDTLRELGLFLEDLYSWSPKELRTVVLDKILAKSHVIRRTVVDRWFNRTDFRRSQILSLLAANIFRPWMFGEEPYGDEELAVREQYRLEQDHLKRIPPPLDQKWTTNLSQEELSEQIRERLSFPATQGLLWFLNVSLGFYLPQVLAHNWADAIDSTQPVGGRMSGNGWDLYHAPNNAIRVADAKREAFAFGMMFLDPRGYRHALEAMTYDAKAPEGRAWRGDASERGNLLLRLWSCCGYSRGRFWSAFSLWRGLSFIGQVIELAWKERGNPRKPFVLTTKKASPERESDLALTAECKTLRRELHRLIRAHCVAGLVPGSLLDRGSNDERLLEGFPAWEAYRELLDDEINSLAEDLLDWLQESWEDRILPLPAGEVWIGWRDCFVRRIHGEYILGSLWPRLKASYMEKQKYDLHEHDLRLLARNRCTNDPKKALEALEKAAKQSKRQKKTEPEYPERFRWMATHAADAWSDILLDYWRGSPQILRLLLTCPVFFKSRERFDRNPQKATEAIKSLQGEEKPTEKADEKVEFLRRRRLERLSLSSDDWEKVTAYWQRSVPEYWERGKEGTGENSKYLPGFVPEELCIERVRIENFAPRPVQHHSLAVERTTIEIPEQENRQRTVTVTSKPEPDAETKTNRDSS